MPQILYPKAYYPKIERPIRAISSNNAKIVNFTLPPESYSFASKIVTIGLKGLTIFQLSSSVYLGLLSLFFSALGEAPSFAINSIYAVTNAAIRGTRRTLENYYKTIQDKESWILAGRIARGDVIESSIMNAKNATEKGRVGFETLSSYTIYGTRFRFYERYLKNKKYINVRWNKKVLKKDMWDCASYSSAMQLLPPYDVADALHEATVLRGIPLAPQIRVVVGALSPTAPTTPAEIAATAAYAEILAGFEASRDLLRGEHLGISVLQQTTEAVLQSVKLINVAYGNASSIAYTSQVGEDDEYWCCMRYGVAARLALRHLSTFVRENNANVWTIPRRAIVEEFTASLRQVALRSTKGQTGTEHASTSRPLNEETIEAVRSFARIRALSYDPLEDHDKTDATLAVATSSQRVIKWVKDNKLSGRDLLTFVETRAMRFEDQCSTKDGKLVPVSPPLNWLPYAEVKAAIASRRTDSDAIDASGFGKGYGIDRIVDDLIALKVSDVSDASDVSDNERAHFYFPLGAGLWHTPSNVPFDVASLTSRMLWLEHVQDAIVNVRRGASVAVNNTNDKPGTMRIISPKNEDRKGLMRHPLICGKEKNKTLVFFAQMPAKPDTPRNRVQTVMDAVNRVYTPQNGNDGRATQIRVQRARALSFNADRMCNAIALARAGNTRPERVEVVVTNDPNEMAYALVFGMAMLRGGTGDAGLSGAGGSPPILELRSDAELMAVLDELQSFERILQTAYRGGLRVARLVEFVHSVV